MPMPDPLSPDAYRDIVRRALAEDIGSGDITTEAVVPAGAQAWASVVAMRACVVAGVDDAAVAFRQVDRAVVVTARHTDGDRLSPGDVIATVSGPARGILTAERTALNLLQHLSGIATATRAYVDKAAGRIVVLDTRKTLPGLRALAKYAVRCGGGTNHRQGLHDGVLIKDNHIRQAGGIGQAVALVRAAGHGLEIEVEAQSLSDVDAALAARADIIMLDNLTVDDMREALGRIGGRARTEISGGVTLDRLEMLATLGADTVSIGALTHSAEAADISLEFETT
jgi:nicotinate-nucleotide pyrophosphorylase (carboxylating)